MLDGEFGLVIGSFAVVVGANVSVFVDQVLGGPVAVGVRLPDAMAVVHDDRVLDRETLDGVLDTAEILGE